MPVHREPPVLGVVGAAATGVESLRDGLIEPAIEAGWRVAVMLTPTAASWLAATGELARIEVVTGLPARYGPRLPSEPRPHPEVDCYAVVPATANTVAKLALGLADNQALTPVCEAIGVLGLPIVVFPRVNAAHTRHPAWSGHRATLRAAGVTILDGPDLWPLYEPDDEPDRPLPWAAILATIAALRPAD